MSNVKKIEIEFEWGYRNCSHGPQVWKWYQFISFSKILDIKHSYLVNKRLWIYTRWQIFMIDVYYAKKKVEK